MCDKRDKATTCVFCHDLHLSSCFLVFYKKTCFKVGEVRRKSFSNKIIVTLVAQGSSSLSSSLLLRKLTNDNRRRSQPRTQILFSSHPLEGGDGKKETEFREYRLS